MEEPKALFSERWAFIILIVAVFVAPLFFMPLMSFQFSKVLVISLAVTIAFALTVYTFLKQKAIVIPRSLFLLSVLVVPFTFFIAGIASLNLNLSLVSLIGYGYEVGTASFIALCFLTLFLVINLFKTKEKVFYAYLAFFASLLVVALFQLVRIVAPESLTFGVFLAPIANLIGKWNDLGIFFAIGLLLSVVSLESLTLSKTFRMVLRIVYVVSLALLLLVNFPALWIFVAIATVMFSLYLLSVKAVDSEGLQVKKVMPGYSIGVLAIALIAFFGANVIGGLTSSKLNISYLEAKPDFTATLSIGKAVMANSPLFGAGPNKFVNAWYNLKPANVNLTPFWNSDFESAAGLIPTFIITTGIIGGIAWLFFFVFLGLLMFKAFRLKVADQFSRYLLVSSLIVSVFLWLIAIFYIPGSLIFFLTFLFTGLFLSLYYSLSETSMVTYSLVGGGNLGIAKKIALGIVLVLALGWGGLVSAKSLSSVYFQKATRVYGETGNIDEGIRYLNKAISLSPNDIYYRALAEFNLIRLNGLVSGNIKPNSNLEAEVTENYNRAQQAASTALLKNQHNYYNWVVMGNVFETVVPAGVPDAYNMANSAYQNAVIANPSNPALYVNLARLEATNNDLPKAREYVLRALDLKSNFTQAAFMLAQIEIELGNLKGAISVVENATKLEPNNSTSFFQLGFLKYNDKDYRGAVEAFDRAIVLVPDYANAKYFRGLSAVNLGDREKAIADFEEIAKANPDNAEVKLVLANIKAGREPFANIASPDTLPEDRETLPVVEE